MSATTSQRMFTATTMAVIVLAALSRLIPHWPNVSPVMAIALFGGAMFASRTKSIAVPLIAMLLSDIALGVVLGNEYAFHSSQIYVYGMLIATSLFGRSIGSQRPVTLVLGGGTAASVAFFLVTNFAVWAHGTMYPHTMAGLGESFAAGLAFYRDGGNFFLNGLVSTWAFLGAMVLATSLVRRNLPTVATA